MAQGLATLEDGETELGIMEEASLVQAATMIAELRVGAAEFGRRLLAVVRSDQR